MQLNISSRFVKAGSIIEVSWDSQEGTNPRLVLQTGERQSTLGVPSSGSKRFRLKGAKGKHCVMLIAEVNGKDKSISKRIFVFGKAKDTDEFEYVDRGDSSPLNRWNNSVGNWWNSYTPEKKRLYIILICLMGIHLLGSFPNLIIVSDILYYILIFWLFWQVVKKD